LSEVDNNELFENPTGPIYSSPIESYNGAAAVVGTNGKTFMTTFSEDQVSSFRRENLYYPFKD
jgi:hypothetical protein